MIENNAVNEVIMKTLINSAVTLIDALTKSAARRGLSFLVMLSVIIGLLAGLWYSLKANKTDRIECKTEMREMKAEYAEQLNELRRDVANCDLERRELAIKVAELTVLVNRKLKR